MGEGWGGGDSKTLRAFTASCIFLPVKTRKTRRARLLRRNMTDAERLLWSKLRRKSLGVKFRRQEPLGPFIVDFVCYEKRLVLEVDGGQHAQRRVRDQRRDRVLEEMGFRVLRFWNHEVLGNIEGVLQRILEALDSPSPQSPPARGGDD